MEILEGEDDGYWRHQQLRSRGNTIEAGTSRDPAQHHRRARARPPEVALVQFAFTEEQELLRREAREALGNGGWTREEIADAELSLPRPGRALRGGRPRERRRVALRRRRARRTSSSRRSRSRPSGSREGARARRRVREEPRAVRPPIGVYQAVSHPLADTYVETELARSLAYWAAWCVAEERRAGAGRRRAAKSYAADAAVAACERSIQVHGGIGFTWEHVLHRVLQARALDPGVRRLRARSSAPRSPPRCSTEREDRPRHRRVVGDRRGVRARGSPRAGWRVLAGVRRAGDAPAGTEEVLLDVTDAGRRSRGRRPRSSELDGLVNNAGIARRVAARVPAARRAAAPARGERRRPGRRDAGLPAGAAARAGPHRLRRLDRRQERAPFLGPTPRRSTRWRRSPTRCGRARARGASASRSSSRARSRRRSGRSGAAEADELLGSPAARPSCTASAIAAFQARRRRSAAPTARRAEKVAAAVEHALTAERPSRALPGGQRRADPRGDRAPSRPAARPRLRAALARD